MRPLGKPILVYCSGWLTSSCPKGKPDYDQVRKAEALQDYDAAFAYYQKPGQSQPFKRHYKIKLNRVRFAASEMHG